jgi:hypothetical protein
VTRTSTYTSTDPSGNIIIATVATVSTPTPEPSPDNSGTNPAIIGGAVGGAVGLIALVGIIWYIVYKKVNGRWDDNWEEDEAHDAGAAEVKQARPAAGNDGFAPNPYIYGVVGGGTQLRADQPSRAHSHSASVSTVAGYADHGRSNSQTPLMSSPPHSPPNSPPTLQHHQLPGGLERTRTPIWASPSAQQQGYFQPGYPPIHPDPNFAPTVNSTYSATSRATSGTASSTQGLLSGYPPPTNRAVSPAYPPGAAPPAIGGGGGGQRNTFIEYHKPPLEPQQPQQQAYHGAVRPPSSQRQRTQTQTEASSSSTNLVDTPVDGHSAVSQLVVAAGLAPSIKDKGGLKGAPTLQNRTSVISVSSVAPPGAPKVLNQPRIVEDAPPAYQQ